ncbi:MAG TPA: sugar ABC transporter permease, partial [Deinococcales bacterium]|nr:sugar ABC transporter permease [Deinococcales bacterium]
MTTAPIRVPGARRGLSPQKRRDLAFGLTLVLPGLVWFLAFNAYPALYSFWISFHDYKLIGPSPFVGLSNYARVFADPVVGIALRNTLVYGLLSVTGQMIAGLGLALLVNQPFRFAGPFRVVYYF